MTTKNYQVIVDDEGVAVGIYEPTTGCIPLDESNKDYQEYLASLEATEPEAE
jgi:hypothetical protein